MRTSPQSLQRARFEQTRDPLRRRDTTDPSYQKQWHLHTRLNDSQFDRRPSGCEAAWQLLDNFGSADVIG